MMVIHPKLRPIRMGVYPVPAWRLKGTWYIQRWQQLSAEFAQGVLRDRLILVEPIAQSDVAAEWSAMLKLSAS